ncbi:hypothetical protein [Nocardia salmonicida]|uniref:hypothetical protein n=1 Tax=Nocardia salmonicida TaxID=53431 RepID=UPI00157D846F|nr:hypothetical protein [Nocardia salmonicida]
MFSVDRSHKHVRITRMRVAVTALPLAVALWGGAATAHAVPGDQAGVTDSPSTQGGVTPAPSGDQPGVSAPKVTPPARPQEQSPLGVIIPDPPTHAPSEYQSPPSGGGGGVQVGPYYDSPAPSAPAPQPYYYVEPPTPQYRAPAPAPAPSLGEELLTLHAPAPVPEKPKYWVPVGPERLGSKRASIETPSFVPVDVAWKSDAYISEAQHATNTALQSVGISPSRADALAGGTVIGAAAGTCIGATVIGVPAAVFGAVAGGLIGGTIGGVAGAAMGTLIPVPVVGTVTSGVAGTALGAAAGAAAGAAIVGIPAALIGGAAGGAIGGLVGFVLLSDDGSEYTGPGVDGEIPMEEREVPEPGPTLTEQFTAQAETAITAGEDAVEWVETQPGGEQILDQAATVVDQAETWVQQQPWVEPVSEVVNTTVDDAVEWAQQQPFAPVVDAAIEVVEQAQPFTPEQFGPLTDQANQALAAVQGALG